MIKEAIKQDIGEMGGGKGGGMFSGPLCWYMA
jgi:hypothetical protein